MTADKGQEKVWCHSVSIIINGEGPGLDYSFGGQPAKAQYLTDAKGPCNISSVLSWHSWKFARQDNLGGDTPHGIQADTLPGVTMTSAGEPWCLLHLPVLGVQHWWWSYTIPRIIKIIPRQHWLKLIRSHEWWQAVWDGSEDNRSLQIKFGALFEVFVAPRWFCKSAKGTVHLCLLLISLSILPCGEMVHTR